MNPRSQKNSWASRTQKREQIHPNQLHSHPFPPTPKHNCTFLALRVLGLSGPAPPPFLPLHPLLSDIAGFPRCTSHSLVPLA